MDAHHIGVFGDSGSGKSTYIHERHATFSGLSIYLNHHGEGGIRGARIHGYEGALRADRTTLNMKVDDPVVGAKQARSFAREYASETGHPAQIVVDEAQDVMPDGSADDNPVRDGLHKDRDRRIKWVVATQDPSDLAYGPLKQCAHFVWVGEPASWHEGFFRYFRVPRDDLPGKRFRYVVLDKQMNVVHRGTTDPTYG